MLFIAIGVILIFIFQMNRIIDTRKFIRDVEPYFRFLMENDYKFLLSVKYKGELDVEKLFQQRVRNGIVGILCMLLIFLNNLTFVNILIAIIVGFV